MNKAWDCEKMRHTERERERERERNSTIKAFKSTQYSSRKTVIKGLTRTQGLLSNTTSTKNPTFLLYKILLSFKPFTV